ncbi:MAG: Crp/Fnr family transcriptional regulator [Saprospiraceae bacterium]|nr:Crp/Fnr family transcriptional regulator [Saprospiraceae bacterium]
MIRHSIEKKIAQPLTDEEFAFFSDLLRSKTVAKKEILISEGDRCPNIYFVEKGALCSFLTTDTGEAHVIQFALEGYWISDLYSFFSEKPAIYTIEALEDCQLLALDKAGFQTACDHLPKVERFFRLLIQTAYVHAQYRIARTFSADAEQRYLELLEEQPDIVQRVPQFLIASYLGVKPQSLSRIRKQIFERR